MSKFDAETFYRVEIAHIRPYGLPGYTERLGPYSALSTAKGQVTKAENWASVRGRPTPESKIEKLTGTWEEIE